MSPSVQLVCSLLALMLLQPIISNMVTHGGNDGKCLQECRRNQPGCPDGCACVLNNSNIGKCVSTNFSEEDFPETDFPHVQPE
uniref:Basic tail secreted protein n=1 Tax=Rhipicephalus appendiculatus TaxID=34631 RepID=A0A131YBM9_RHIAP